jgi:sarcosine oxidase subunit beta
VHAISSDTRRIETRTVINAAGAWAGHVGGLAGVQIPVTPSPRCQMVTERDPALPSTTPFVIDLETGAHLRMEGGRAIAGVRPASEPVGFVLQTDADPIAWIADRAAVRFPFLRDARVSGFISGLYEITPDGLPLAGAIDGIRGFYVAAGFNGHGIMHGPAIAEAVAELIVGGRPASFDLGPFAPQRFAGGVAEAVRVSSLL